MKKRKGQFKKTTVLLNKNEKIILKPKKVVEIIPSKYRPLNYEAALEIPEIYLSIKFDQNRFDTTSLDVKIGIDMTIRKVIEIINEKHNFSCKSVKIYIIEDGSKKYMDVFLYKSFKELGIKPGETLNLFYEYEPVKHPLLEAGLV